MVFNVYVAIEVKSYGNVVSLSQRHKEVNKYLAYIFVR